MVCKSHFPQATVHIADISDEALLKEWAALNHQILFNNFATDGTKFDFIFMNDVFEHVSDPIFVLKQMSEKLKPGGKVFIDTPKQFWIYPVARVLSKKLYTKVLRGTVSTVHLQIWSKTSLEKVLNECGMNVSKYKEVSEYTMPAEYYMKNMGINNPILKLVGQVFYREARFIAKNKILCVLSKQDA